MLDGKYEVDGRTLAGRDALALALIQKAAAGDVSAFNAVRDTIGEKPKDRVEHSGEITIESLLKGVKDRKEY